MLIDPIRVVVTKSADGVNYTARLEQFTKHIGWHATKYCGRAQTEKAAVNILAQSLEYEAAQLQIWLDAAATGQVKLYHEGDIQDDNFAS